MEVSFLKMILKNEIMDLKERGDKIHVDENMSDHGKMVNHPISFSKIKVVIESELT